MMPTNHDRATAIDESSSLLWSQQPTPDIIAKSEHLGASRQYWRDIILGVNDGLISTFLLVTGVAGGGLTSDQILLTALAGALAGAVSMAAGEFVATKSQNEVLRGEIELEREHVRENMEDEMEELGDLLGLIGITPKDGAMHEQLLTFYRHNSDALLKIMKTLEFGLLEEEERSPVVAGGFSCLLFVAGSLPSVLPFIFSGDNPLMGLFWATGCTITALLAVGAIKTWATRGDCLTSALENLVIAGFGGVLAFAVGFMFDHLIHHAGDEEFEVLMR